MKLYKLVLLMGLIGFLNNEKPILAQSADEDVILMKKDNGTNDETDQEVVLIEKIFNLLLSGHSTNEVIAILNAGKEHPYAHQKLVAEVNYLLNKHYSKDNVVNIIVNNKEAEKFYAWQNFKAKLELAAFLTSLGAILYWVYGYGNKSDEGLLPHHKETRLMKRPPTKKKIHKSEPRKTLVKKKSVKANKGPFRLSYVADRRLERAIERQIEYAKVFGPAEIEFDVIDIDQEPFDDRKFDEKIAEQLESARSIGLEPA